MDNIKNLATGLMHLYPEKVFFKNLLNAIEKYPELIHENFLSEGQIKSKRWLVKELENLALDLGVTYLTPGWFGLLAGFIDESQLSYSKIRSFDMDQKSVDISDLLNRNLLVDGWKFKASCKNIFDINYSEHLYLTMKNNESCQVSDAPDTIINTACEHIDYIKWLDVIPENKLIVLQNNNFFECAEHTHCVQSAEEFAEKCNLKTIYYSGTLKLQKYERFMLIGRT